MTDSQQWEVFLCLDETFFDGFWELMTPYGGLGWVSYFWNKEIGFAVVVSDCKYSESLRVSKYKVIYLKFRWI
jgi:hypothetical protein